MSGITLRNGVLSVDREPTPLDTLALDVSDVLEAEDVSHAAVAGYVAILAGRSRATEDIDVIVEPLDAGRAESLATAFDRAGFWGAAMPLEDLHEMLSAGSNLRVARDDDVIPNVELSYAADTYDRASLSEALTARIGERTLPIGPLELQIAYKLRLDTPKDFEDAVHLYTMFEESLSTADLERWVVELEVTAAYDRLGDA